MSKTLYNIFGEKYEEKDKNQDEPIIHAPIIRRVWAMPDKNTFNIKPIKELIYRHKYGLTIDPFANINKIADITNDIDERFDTTHHMDAYEFLKTFEDKSVDTVLFDKDIASRKLWGFNPCR
jgi:hypothetical protein